jgi:hypothetical protein
VSVRNGTQVLTLSAYGTSAARGRRQAPGPWQGAPRFAQHLRLADVHVYAGRVETDFDRRVTQNGLESFEAGVDPKERACQPAGAD